MKGNMRNADGVKRTDSYTVDAKSIMVDFAENPRIDYGGEDFQEMKESIRNEGVLTPLFVYVDKETNKLHLAHGFRRMKAILELLDEGLIEAITVPVKQVENNREAILGYHVTLNSGKPFSELELANTLVSLYKLNGGDYAKAAKRTNLPYQKAKNLIDFALEGTTLAKDMVQKGEVSITNAMDIAKQANGSEAQNEILTKARESAQSRGSKKVKPDDLRKGGATLTNNKRVSDSGKVYKGFIKFLDTMGVQNVSLAELVELSEKIENGATIDELMENYTTPA